MLTDRAAPLGRRLTDLYIFVMLFAFPLYTGPGGYVSITRSKYLFFVCATLLWLAGLLVCALLRRIRRGDMGRSGLAGAAVAAYMAVACLSTVCSPHAAESLLGAGRWDGLATLLLYGAVFLGVRAFGRLRRAHLYALGAAVLLCAGISVAQLLGHDPLGLFPGTLDYFDAHTRYAGEFLGTIGNVDLLSGFLCLCVPLFAAAFVTDRRLAPLLLPAGAGLFLLLAARVAGGLVGLGVCVLLCAPLLLRTRARLFRALLAAAALLFAAFWALALDFSARGVAFSHGLADLLALCGAAACLALAGLVHLHRSRPEPPPETYGRALGLLAALTAALGLATVYFWPGESGTVYEFSRLLHGELRDEFGSSRIRIWRETLALFPERPLLGGGPGTLALRLDIEFSRFVPETGQTLRTYVDNAHNEYLGVLTDTGLLGLLCYLTAMAASFIGWLRNLAKRRDEASLIPAAGCALVCYWAQAFFGLGLCLVAPLYWLLWGLADFTAAERPDAPAESSPRAGSE